MPTIGIIDDRSDQRKTLKNFIFLKITEISDKWDIIDEPPLQNLQDYPSWLLENEISILILDERLRETSNSSTRINYDGHEVVDYIRSTLHTLPIYVVTAYPYDSEIVQRFPDVEEIISREELTDSQKNYMPRLLRAGQKYLEVFQKELATLSVKAEKIAKGNATQKDIDELRSIQSKINTSLPLDSMQTQNDWLKSFEEGMEQLEIIYNKAEKLLKKKK